MNLENPKNSTVVPAPSLLALAQQAVDDWPEFDGDDDVPGADLVGWFGNWRDEVKQALAGAVSDVRDAATRMMAESQRQAKELAKDLPCLYASLTAVIPLVETYLDDWRTGVADGTYESGNELVKAEETVRAAKEALARAEADGLKRPSLAIIIEGGVVQDVVTDMPEAFDLQRFVIIDYDTDGADEVMLVPQSAGTESEALVTDLPNPTLATIPLDKIDDWETFTRVDGPAW